MLFVICSFLLVWNEPGNVSIHSHFEVAHRYAPFIYHETDARKGRQDLIAPVDFDGDLIGNNNWENFEKYPLKPTVYYSVLETETHYFIAYHLFHPRDWNHFTFWLHDTHENDGENLQVTVQKSDNRVILLWTQAHYGSEVYAQTWSGISDGRVTIDGEFLLVDENGIPSDTSSHVAVFVESEGHGIYGALSTSSGVGIGRRGDYRFEGNSGIIFRPAASGEEVSEPRNTNEGAYPYELNSIQSSLWLLLRDGFLSGDGKLLDGSVIYRDDLVGIVNLPRYYDADRYSGPFGSDRGISPFALDFDFSEGTLGALFFNPAQRYKDQLSVSGPWSTKYLHYPFCPK